MAQVTRRLRLGAKRLPWVVAVTLIATLGTLTSLGAAQATTTPPVVAVSSNGAFVTDAVPLPAGAPSVPLPAESRIGWTVVLAPSNETRLEALDAGLLDSGSPEYRRYLTEREFQSEFSPLPTAVQAVETYFAGYEAAKFSTTGDRFGLSFTIPVAEADASLGITLVAYGHVGTRIEYTALGTPQLPASLQGIVVGIDGLSDGGQVRSSLSEMRPLAPVSSLQESANDFVLGSPTGPQWFIGSDYTQATRTSDLFPTSPAVSNATFPTHEAVATILMSSYNQSDQLVLPPWDPSVVGQYFNDTLPASWPHPTLIGVDVPVFNVSAPPPGSLHDLNDSTGDEIENSLDLEMAGSLAPGALIANFYFSAAVYLGTSTGDWQSIADDFAQTLAAALNYSYANATLVAVTNSYGLPDLSNGLWNAELVNAATTGVTVVAASGDQGDAPPSISGRFQGQWPTWPGTAAGNTSGTVAVGGASLTLSGSATGQFISGVNNSLPDQFDSNITGIQSEVPWYTGGPNDSGTEGGGSVVVSEPSWQRDSAAQPSIVNMTVLEGLSFLPRAEPDVAGPANNTISYVLAWGGQIYFTVLAGTSVASPEFAGMLASEAAVAGHRFGFLDPELYNIGSYFALNPSSADPFQSISVGSNYLFEASAGWDPLTGWGTVDAVNFLAADQNASIADFQNPVAEPGLPPEKAPSSASPPTISGYYVPILLTVGILFTALLVLVIVLSARRQRRPPEAGLPPPGAMTYQYAPPPAGVPPSSTNYGYSPPAGGGTYLPPSTNPSGSGGANWQWSSGPPPVAPSATPPRATFECPYCGFERPAEAGRCPHCGAF